MKSRTLYCSKFLLIGLIRKSFKNELKNHQGTYNTIVQFSKIKTNNLLMEGWMRQKTINKCKQMYFIPQTVQLIFGGLNINKKWCSTFTFMYLGTHHILRYYRVYRVLRMVKVAQTEKINFKANNIICHGDQVNSSNWLNPNTKPTLPS